MFPWGSALSFLISLLSLYPRYSVPVFWAAPFSSIPVFPPLDLLKWTSLEVPCPKLDLSETEEDEEV